MNRKIIDVIYNLIENAMELCAIVDSQESVDLLIKTFKKLELFLEVDEKTAKIVNEYEPDVEIFKEK